MELLAGCGKRSWAAAARGGGWRRAGLPRSAPVGSPEPLKQPLTAPAMGPLSFTKNCSRAVMATAAATASVEGVGGAAAVKAVAMAALAGSSRSVPVRAETNDR